MRDYLQNGLTNTEIQEKNQKGLVNRDENYKTKSIKTIFFENIFTLFNIINAILGVLIFITGSYKNMLFLGVAIINTAISIFQNIRSKKIIDKLSILSNSKVRVLRNKKEYLLNTNEVVLDDLAIYKPGDSIMLDSKILSGSVEVNESFLTGEEKNVYKKKGDILLSGSFIISGNCKSQVFHIGKENYSSKMTAKAKYIKANTSEILKSLNRLIKIISIIILPISIILFNNQIRVTGNINLAIINVVAALESMIPEGLILLTSTVLAVSIIKLAKDKVLVQDLYSIETLARVDMICFDKTGTLTEGKIKVKKYINISGDDEKFYLKEYLGKLNDNSTSNAILEKYGCSNKWECIKKIPFSSERKYSAVSFSNGKTIIIGAPEFLLNTKKYDEILNKYANKYRVLAVLKSNEILEKNTLPKNFIVMGFLLMEDVIKKDSKQIINYFEKEGVKVKIISGDNSKTIKMIADKVGLKSNKIIDLNTDEIDINADIFARVTPDQKLDIIKKLKENHTVAFVGDGINDVLALKEADISIAPKNATDSARNAAQVILLNNDFASIPKIVNEGRRTINNVKRSASLFIVKTIYATVFAVLFSFVTIKYPFIPIQLSFIGSLTIGIPSFVLALEPNYKKVKKGFLKDIFMVALPTSISIITAVLLNIFIGNSLSFNSIQISSICVFSLSFIGILHLCKISYPLNNFRKCLILLLAISLFLGALFFTKLLSITILNVGVYLFTFAISFALFIFFTFLFIKI